MHNVKKSDYEKEDTATIRKKIEMYRKIVQAMMELKKAGDFGPETLELSKRVLQMNPDYYEAWNVRKEAIEKASGGGADGAEVDRICADDMKLSRQCLALNPKSYASWYQRKWLVDKGLIKRPGLLKELELTEKMLDFDERNFHCWTHRKFIAMKLQLPLASELAFTRKQIERNFSNYSAWHYRATLLDQTAAGLAALQPSCAPAALSAETVLAEKELVFAALYTEPEDCSAWLYFVWLVSRAVGVRSLLALVNSDGGFGALALKEDFAEALREVAEIGKEEKRCEWAMLVEAILAAVLAKAGVETDEVRRLGRGAVQRLSSAGGLRANVNRYIAECVSKIL